MKRPYIIAIGRCPEGLEYDGQSEYREVRYVLLLLAARNTRNYLNGLASIVRVFKDGATMARMDDARSLKDFRQIVKSAFSGDDFKPRRRHNRFNKLILKEAAKIAKGANCNTILIFGDAFADGADFGAVFEGFKTVLITQRNSSLTAAEKSNIHAVLSIRSYSKHRFSQLRSAVLVGLTRGIFSS